ncbi:MAG: hypothetical protein H7Z20_01120 [Bdellovibrio sp.]|nr:hypothetical protein [Methylotenera sp.]
MKIKTCATCQLTNTTLYRVQISVGKEWIFICAACIKIAKLLPSYRYGGTWQGKRH